MTRACKLQTLSDAVHAVHCRRQASITAAFVAHMTADLSCSTPIRTWKDCVKRKGTSSVDDVGLWLKQKLQNPMCSEAKCTDFLKICCLEAGLEVREKGLVPECGHAKKLCATVLPTFSVHPQIANADVSVICTRVLIRDHDLKAHITDIREL